MTLQLNLHVWHGLFPGRGKAGSVCRLWLPLGEGASDRTELHPPSHPGPAVHFWGCWLEGLLLVHHSWHKKIWGMTRSLRELTLWQFTFLWTLKIFISYTQVEGRAKEHFLYILVLITLNIVNSWYVICGSCCWRNLFCLLTGVPSFSYRSIIQFVALWLLQP